MPTIFSVRNVYHILLINGSRYDTKVRTVLIWPPLWYSLLSISLVTLGWLTTNMLGHLFSAFKYRSTLPKGLKDSQRREARETPDQLLSPRNYTTID